MPASADARRALIESDHESLSIRHQCELLDLPRSTLYYRPASETPENLSLMRLLDKQYLKTPYYGSRKMAIALAAHGQAVNRKRVQRLMRIMGIEGLAPRRSTSRPAPGHRVFPYRLPNLFGSRSFSEFSRSQLRMSPASAKRLYRKHIP